MVRKLSQSYIKDLKILNVIDFSHSEAIKNSIFLISRLKNLNFDKNLTFTSTLILRINKFGPKLT